jgi:multicomponent Na+:H+ antiporter subunit A
MLIAILFGFIILPLLLLLPQRYDRMVNANFFLLPLLSLIYFSHNFFSKSQDTVQIISDSGIVSFKFTWNFDSLSFLFVSLILGIGTLIFWYAGAYMKPGKDARRLFAFLSMFMAAMLGVVLSDHLISLFLFWELTSFSSFFLIGFNFREKASRDSALTALAITGGGGLIMLSGFVILAELAGTYFISEMINQSEFIFSSPEYPIIFITILIGAITKSAQFPFHFWLPSAMKAPTPVSAYLHSATMVKAGVYLLMRFSPVLGGNEIWEYTLIAIGGVTMLYAAFISVSKTDLKSILAFSTVSSLGLMVFLLGLGTKDAFVALALFILVHGLYKASLFLITGLIDHETGIRDINRLSGLRKVLMPVALAGLIAALSSGGVPPFIGFIGKDLVYEAGLHFPTYNYLIVSALVVTNILLFASGFLAGWKAFSGELPDDLKPVQLPATGLWVPPLILAVLSLLFGLFPQWPELLYVADISKYLALEPFSIKLKLWHGFNLVLLLSAITIICGLALYRLAIWSNIHYRFEKWVEFPGPKYAIEKTALIFNRAAWKITNTLQSGYLSHYIRIITLFVSGLLVYKVLQTDGFSLHLQSLLELTVYEVIISLILIVSIVLTVFSRSRLKAVAFMGVVGMAMCLIFVFYSAPDLAMTQFTIDTLTVILFVLVLFRLPKFIPFNFGWKHLIDAVVAISFGGVIVLLILVVLGYAPDREISSFYADNSYLLAKGKNIVNVILVDFRGADTLIEIVVLTISAIGVFSLLKLYIHDKKQINE